MYKHIKSTLATIIKPSFYYLRDLVYKNHIHVDFYSKNNNYGDILNSFLINKISGKKVLEVRSRHFNNEHFFVIGSVLQDVNRKSIVWGSGFISQDSLCKEPPKKILAVRGPLTRNILVQQGIGCPKVFGDPALLMPMIYKPKKIPKKFKLGIIPHYIDKSHMWLKYAYNNKNVKIIDIQTNNFEGFIDDILSCEKIVSSSLHGIILADAYKVDSLWIEFSKKVYGDGFKFYDYFQSINKTVKSPFQINQQTTIEEILNSFENFELNFDPTPLINSCPFKFKSEYHL
jgi:pyruvyltransferase